jgi:hypothetical protein
MQRDGAVSMACLPPKASSYKVGAETRVYAQGAGKKGLFGRGPIASWWVERRHVRRF